MATRVVHGEGHPNQAAKYASKIMRGEVALGDPALARDYQVLD